MSLRMKRKAPASSPGGEDVKVETFVHDDFAGRYDGEADDEGRPHGVGILRLDDDGAWYQGEFRHGAKHGQGTLHFPPDDSDDDENISIKMQGTLATTPTEDDWFDIEGTSIGRDNIDGSTLAFSSNFTGNFVWVRAKVSGMSAGAVSKILYNN